MSCQQGTIGARWKLQSKTSFSPVQDSLQESVNTVLITWASLTSGKSEEEWGRDDSASKLATVCHREWQICVCWVKTFVVSLIERFHPWCDSAKWCQSLSASSVQETHQVQCGQFQSGSSCKRFTHFVACWNFLKRFPCDWYFSNMVLSKTSYSE